MNAFNFDEQHVFVIHGQVYVTYHFIETLKVSRQTIYNHTQKGAENRWFTRSHPRNNKNKLVLYKSINKNIFKCENPPTESLLRKMEKNYSVRLRKCIEKNTLKLINDTLDIEYRYWHEKRWIYENDFDEVEVIEKYCKTHVLFEKIIELKKFYMLKDLFLSYCRYADVVFQTDNYRSFCLKVKNIEKASSIEEALIHGLKHKRGNRARITNDIIFEIKKHFSDKKKLNAEQILDKVNEYLISLNRPKISISSVYKVISSPLVQLECYISRFGKRYAQVHLLPDAHFLPPIKENLLWCLDGSKLQFYYKTEKSKYNRLTVYVVLDGKTRRIIGHTYSTNENTAMAIKALENACDAENCLPVEMIYDQSSAHTSERYQVLVSKAKTLGVYCHMTRTGNAQDNSYAENFFAVFQEKYCRKYDGFIGDGIITKNENKKIPEELIKQYISPGKLKTKDELIRFIEGIIKEYNNRKIRAKFVDQQNKRYPNPRQSELEPIPLSPLTKLMLFGEQIERKLREHNLKIEEDGVTHYYELYEFDSLVHRKKYVNIYYYKRDLSTIYLFDIKTDNYIGKLKRWKKVPKITQLRNEQDSKIMNNHRKKKEKLKSDLHSYKDNIDKQHRKNQNSIPAELINSSENKKKREQAEEKYVNELMQNFDANEKMKIIKTSKQKNSSSKGIVKHLYEPKGNFEIYEYRTKPKAGNKD